MSRVRVLWLVVRADVRARPLPAVLTALVVAMATATLTLTLALAVGRATDEPFDRAFAETRGPDVPPASVRSSRWSAVRGRTSRSPTS